MVKVSRVQCDWARDCLVEAGVGNRGLVIWGSPMLLGDWEGVKCDGCLCNFATWN